MLCRHCWNSIAVLKKPHPQPFFYNRGRVKTTTLKGYSVVTYEHDTFFLDELYFLIESVNGNYL